MLDPWLDPEESRRRPWREAAQRSLRLPAPTRFPARWPDNTSPGPSSSSACTSSHLESGSKSRSNTWTTRLHTYLMYFLGTNLFLYFCTFLHFRSQLHFFQIETSVRTHDGTKAVYFRNSRMKWTARLILLLCYACYLNYKETNKTSELINGVIIVLFNNLLY